MISFIVGLILLVLGYFLYGKYVEKIVDPKADVTTPAYEKHDAVDYIPLPTWKVYLIQFLNIAGTGPIFGAILGILYGPAAFLWIVIGCIFIVCPSRDYDRPHRLLREGGRGTSPIKDLTERSPYVIILGCESATEDSRCRKT